MSGIICQEDDAKILNTFIEFCDAKYLIIIRHLTYPKMEKKMFGAAEIRSNNHVVVFLVKPPSFYNFVKIHLHLYVQIQFSHSKPVWI